MAEACANHSGGSGKHKRLVGGPMDAANADEPCPHCRDQGNQHSDSYFSPGQRGGCQCERRSAGQPLPLEADKGYSAWEALYAAGSYTDRADDTIAMQRLLDRGARINVRDLAGETALFSAVTCENERAVRWLLDRGADIDTRNKDGRTALYSAAKQGSFKTLRLLIACGADVRAKDNGGQTVLNYAQTMQSPISILNLLRQAEKKQHVRHER